MQVLPTNIDGCFIIENKIHGDERGYFLESYNAATFKSLTGIETAFVQDNQSFSGYGVLRGLHFQTGEHAQAKLVRVIQGMVLDVVVDIRKNSPSFGQHVAIELSDDNRQQLYVPRGLAHGFVVLSETATFFYKCDKLYSKAAESGIMFNDTELNIDWKVPEAAMILSEKDKTNLSFRAYVEHGCIN
ncbi:MAG: dTDP-4-dehydrorhamnose 3,5-epimerase [Chitinophagaceae bacterium]